MLADHENKAVLNAQIVDIIDKALTASGLSARAVSIDVVGHDGLIRDIKRGNVPTADRLDALFKRLGVDFSLGSSGDKRAISPKLDDNANLSLIDLQSIARDIQLIKSALLHSSSGVPPEITRGDDLRSLDGDRLEKAIRLTDKALTESSKTLEPNDRASAYSLVYDMLDGDAEPTTDNIVSIFR